MSSKKIKLSSQENQNKKNKIINQQTSNGVDVDNFKICFSDKKGDFTIFDATTLKISDNFVDKYLNHIKSEFLSDELTKNNKNIVSLYNKFKNEKVTIHEKRIIRQFKKDSWKENDNFLNLLNDVIFNIEVNCNDRFNLKNKINLFNTELIYENNNQKSSSIRIEKPLQVKITNEITWNDKFISSILKIDVDKTKNKEYISQLKSMTTNEISDLIKKEIYIVENLDGYIFALECLYKSISQSKPSNIMISLYNLIMLLKTTSNVSNEIFKCISNFSSYKTTSDFDLIQVILKTIDKNKILNELNEEILAAKVIFDDAMHKYTIAQQIAKKTILYEINSVTNVLDNSNKSGSKLVIKSTNEIAQCSSIYEWRKKLAKYVNNLKTNELDVIFEQINNEINIIYDLKELMELLEKDINKKIDSKGYEFKSNYKNLEKFLNERHLIDKKMHSFLLIYQFINFHFDLILFLQNTLSKYSKKQDINWVEQYNQWLNNFNKKNISKVNK